MIAITVNFWKSSTLLPKFILSVFFIVALTGCVKLPTPTDYPSTKIITGPGPEDMVMDSLTNRSNPRLLVSCASRRKSEQQHGEIWAVNLKTDEATILPRRGEPAGLGFRPHGIDIVKHDDGIVYLYVINHQDSLHRQIIMKYIVRNSYLEFVAAHENPILTSPNDVCFDPSGGFYWTNDASKRSMAFVEPVFRIKGGYIGRRTRNGTWEKSRSKFAYANGLAVLQGDLYVSTVIQGKIFRFKNQDLQSKPETVCKVPGGDNISILPNGNLLVTAHLRQIKFIKHLNKSENKSPSVVYMVNPTNNEKKAIYSDNGHTISTASTAIWYNGHLYVCQVFDGFIIKAKTGTL